MKNRSLSILVILLAVVVVFGIATPVAAEIKATAPFYILDDVVHTYQNSNVNVFLGGYPDGETHVLHELGLDNDPYDPVAGDVADSCQIVADLGLDPANHYTNGGPFVQNCPDPKPAPWNGEFAGVFELGIAHTKSTPDGVALLFIQSEDWSVVSCDLNDDDAFDGADLAIDTLAAIANDPNHEMNPDSPLYHLPTWFIPGDDLGELSEFFKVLAIDYEQPCSQNTCDTELVTYIFVDLDTNGNGELDAGDNLPEVISPQLKTGGVCFHAAIYPDLYEAGDPIWPNPGQARIGAGGGDKTVNITTSGPSAITIESLVAQSPGGIHPFVWLSIAALLTGIAFVLIRASRQHPRQISIRKDD